MFADFFKSIAQFDDPKFRLVVWRGLGLTFAVLITAFTLIVMGLNQLAQSAAVTAIIGETSWLGNLLNIGGVLFTFVLSIWVMVPIASAIISSFFDEVARAVEARYYPNLPATRGMKLQDQILTTLGLFWNFTAGKSRRSDLLDLHAVSRTVYLLGRQRLFVGTGIFPSGRHASHEPQ